MISRTSAAVLLIVLTLPITSFARINRVPESFRTIQAAIDATHERDTIVVDPGVYHENLLFDGHNIVVGSFIVTIGGDDWIEETVIDGGGEAGVVTFRGEGTEQSTLKGFTIRNGESPWGGGISVGAETRIVLEDLLITGNHATEDGGGLYVSRARPILRRVVIRANSADNGGGGAYFDNANPELENCQIISNEAEFASGIYSESSDLNLSRALIAHNTSAGDGSVVLWGGRRNEGDSFLDHLTIYGNQCDDDHTAGLILDTENAYDITASLTNSIIWNNDGIEIVLKDGGNEWDGIGFLSVSYSDVEIGQDTIEVGEHDTLDWGEGNIEEEARFVSPDDFDFRLRRDSPCIDSGDPDFQRDADGTTTDMGALGIFQPEMILAGVVVDAETNDPIPFASGTGYANLGFVMWIECDSNGVWSRYGMSGMQRLTLRMSAAGYLNSNQMVDIPDVDSFWIETRLYHAEFAASRDTVSVELDSGEFARIPFSIRNEGNGPLTWSSEVRNPGGSGYRIGMMRGQMDVTTITGDASILGVVFDGEHYYFAGSNGESPNMIWVVNREGEQVRRFQQPGTSRSGFRDVEWDGEFIWGASQDTLFAFDRQGNVRRRWAGPDLDVTNVAYDPNSDVLWISGTTSDIAKFDRNGNSLGISLSRRAMRIYGLGWLTDATDSCNLIVLQNPGESLPIVTAMNPISGDTLHLAPIDDENNHDAFGLFVCQTYDRYGGSVLMTVRNIALNEGGDRLEVIQLQANRTWAVTEPARGSIPPGEQRQINVRINSSSEDYNWGLNGGEYSGELIFSHDGRGDDFLLPLKLEVIPPVEVQNDEIVQPQEVSFKALYPQPFNSAFVVEYNYPALSEVNINLTDISGRRVAQVRQVNLAGGSHKAIISGENLGSGVYLLSLNGSFGNVSRKVVLIR